MFRAFDFSLTNWSKEDQQKYFEVGSNAYAHNQEIVRKSLATFVQANGKLDGGAIRQNWFPQINADVFLSHSHADEKLAISLAGLFSHFFLLRSFIDSCVWGCADELLREIDDRHCLFEDKKSYNYILRNGSTSHVHMMLHTALAMMIDSTECAMFLNTPNSISTEQAVQKTESPWIFAEIATLRLVRPKYSRQLVKEGLHTITAKERLPIEHPVDLSSFARIDLDTLNRWIEQNAKSQEHPLDILYALVPPK
jgi:hypothetical protein